MSSYFLVYTAALLADVIPLPGTIGTPEQRAPIAAGGGVPHRDDGGRRLAPRSFVVRNWRAKPPSPDDHLDRA